MPSYGIFRVEKLKKVANLKGSLMHAFREQETPNADPQRKSENTLLTPDTYNVESTLEKYNQLKPTGKIRSDVVHAIEVLVTASPEKIKAMNNEERNQYFKEALAFCNSQFGDKNLLHAQIHNDETTAHLTAFYIPVIEKTNKKGETVRRLNANSLLGGKREYSERQTAFYEQVSKKYGLERGEVGSKATHKKILDWYSELNASNGVTLDEVMKELESKKQVSVNVDVEVPKKNFLGIYTETEEETRSIKLNTPFLRFPDVKDALKPHLNANSEMKRRQKEAYKKEVRKEVEEEVKAKFEAEKAEVARKEKIAINAVKNVRVFYKTLSDKIGLDIQGKDYPQVRKAIIEQLELNQRIVEESKEALAFRREVNDEVYSWVFDSGKRAYADFDEYKQAFRDRQDSLRAKDKKYQSLLEEKEKLNKALKESENELYPLKNLKEKALKVLGNFFEGDLIKSLERLVDIAKKISDPDFIKEQFVKHCEQKTRDNRDFIYGNLRYTLDGRNSTNSRINAFNMASNRLMELLKYTDKKPPNDLLELFNEAQNEAERLSKMPRMSRY